MRVISVKMMFVSGHMWSTGVRPAKMKIGERKRAQRHVEGIAEGTVDGATEGTVDGVTVGTVDGVTEGRVTLLLHRKGAK